MSKPRFHLGSRCARAPRDGRHLNRNSPVDITANFPTSFSEEGTHVKAVAAGGAHSLLLLWQPRKRGHRHPWGLATRIFAWGCGWNGQLGIGWARRGCEPVPHSVRLAPWHIVKTLSAGRAHSLAITLRGGVACMGKRLGRRARHGLGRHRLSLW